MSIVVNREDLNPCTVVLNVVCGPDAVKVGFDKAYKQAAKQVRVPGFRPGHAPRHLVENSVPKQTVYELAADEIVKVNWKKAVEQENLEPFQSPVVDLKRLQEGTEVDEAGKKLEALCEFDIKVPLKPIVELGDYRALTAIKPKIDVTDEDVERQIEEMRQRRGKREQVVDRGIEDGDIAVVNIKGEGIEGDGHTLMTIVGQSFGDLDAALQGMNAEELKSVDLKFPKDFQEKSLAGKELHATITVRSVNTQRLPELDDSFAQSLNAENVSELRNRIKEVMLRTKQEQSQAYVNEQLLDGLLAQSTINVPDTMWEQVTNQRLNDIAREQQEAGQSVEDYVKSRGMSVEEFVEAVTTEAKMFVHRAQAIQEIFVKEELKIDNNALNEELAQMAAEFGMHPKDLADALQKNNSLEEIYHRAIHRKVMNFLNSHATVTETEGDAEAKPAAKPKKSEAKAEKAEKAEKGGAKAEAKPKAKGEGKSKAK